LEYEVMDHSGDVLHDLYLRMRVLDQELAAMRSARRPRKGSGTWWERFLLVLAIGSLGGEQF
jgi:hypothetical protein